MAKLFMITGLGSGRDLASGKRGAFYNTLEEFHKHWERIDIITPKVKNPVTNIFGNVFIHVSPWPLFLHPLFFIKKSFELFKNYHFDLMTVQDFAPFYNGIAARILWRKFKVPYSLEIMHIPGYPKSASIKESFYKIFTFLCLRFDAKKATTVRIINQSQMGPLLLKAGVPASKISYVPAFYIDLNIFRPTVVKKEYDLVFIGRLVKNKGINLFIDAVQKSKLRVLIVGDGPLMKSLWQKIKKTDLSGNVIFHGWAKDANEISELLNKSRILVMPSYNEGGPRVVLEAMACGVPVIATSVGMVPDIIKDGESGDIIDWKAGDIVVKSIRLLNDQERYERYSRNGLEIVKRFERIESIRNYADKLKEIIH